MGLFGRKVEPALPEPPEEIAISTDIAAAIPDPGTYFLDWIGEPQRQHLTPSVDALRGANEWIATAAVAKFGVRRWEMGPLTLLNGMMVKDSISMGVWASYGMRSREEHQFRRNVSSLLDTQGHAAAATWALTVRPERIHQIEIMIDSLTDNWAESLATVTNRDLRKSFEKWNANDSGA